MTIPDFDDQPPHTRGLTDYDRRHLVLYARLLDADVEGADWTEVVRILFGLDPKREAERAHRVYDSHLSRAPARVRGSPSVRIPLTAKHFTHSRVGLPKDLSRIQLAGSMTSVG